MAKKTWTKPEKGWISGESKKPSKKKRPADIPYGVIFTPAQCPNKRCHSLDLNCTYSNKEMRYYKCRSCGVNFKALREFQFQKKQ